MSHLGTICIGSLVDESQGPDYLPVCPPNEQSDLVIQSSNKDDPNHNSETVPTTGAVSQVPNHFPNQQQFPTNDDHNSPNSFFRWVDPFITRPPAIHGLSCGPRTIVACFVFPDTLMDAANQHVKNTSGFRREQTTRKMVRWATTRRASCGIPINGQSRAEPSQVSIQNSLRLSWTMARVIWRS
jgi:hypothetical protein